LGSILKIGEVAQILAKYLGSILKIGEEGQNIGLLSFHIKSCILSLTKIGLGHILGDVFKNASGRPASKLLLAKCILKQN
jgi:hypothetical protein